MAVAQDARRQGAAGTLVSVNVGLPKDVSWHGKTVHTGIYKYPVEGPRMVRRLDVDGDGQGDLAGHGGEQRAVMVYQQESYDHWSEHLDRDDLVPGNFGENFTVTGLADNEVCIGDRYRIGDAEFEVTQPRVTCYRVGLRLGVPEMPSLLVSHRRPGFYMRVITEGAVEAGQSIVKVSAGRHRLKVAEIDALLYLPDRSHELLKRAVDVPALSPGWQQSFHELLAAAESGEPAPLTVIGREPEWIGFRPFTVTRTAEESPSVVSLYLADGAGSVLPTPKPGQYLTLRLSIDGTAAVRSYSISGRPDENTYRISVKREEFGSVSTYIHDAVIAGTVIDVAAPRGEFVLDEGDEPVVLLSAGIGITPVLSMLSALAAGTAGTAGTADRPVWWLHVARTAADYGLASEVQAYLRRLPAARSHVWLTRTAPPTGAAPPQRTAPPTGAAPPQRTAPPTGAAPPHDRADPGTTFGRLDLNALRALDLPTAASAYLCGPPGFISAMTEALATLGLAPEHIRTELFGATASLTPGIVPMNPVEPHLPAGVPGTGPAVTFARSALTVTWSDRYESLLELAEACDVSTRWSCRTGVCHTCITGLLSGGVSYSPEPLERPAEAETLLCCSQPLTETVLDA